MRRGRAAAVALALLGASSLVTFSALRGDGDDGPHLTPRTALRTPPLPAPPVPLPAPPLPVPAPPAAAPPVPAPPPPPADGTFAAFRAARGLPEGGSGCALPAAAPAASLHVLHPGKTGGRSLASAVRCQPRIRKLAHHAPAGAAGPNATYAIVLREPRDRLASGLAFMVKGGEGIGDDAAAGATGFVENGPCHAFLRNRTVPAALGDAAGFRGACAAPAHAGPAGPGEPPSDAAFRRQSAWLPADEGADVRVLCFDALAADFDRVLRPFCEPPDWREPRRTCGLAAARRNAARRRPEHFVPGARAAIEAYVAEFYAGDAALYARACGNATRDFWSPRAKPPAPRAACARAACAGAAGAADAAAARPAAAAAARRPPRARRRPPLLSLLAASLWPRA